MSRRPLNGAFECNNSSGRRSHLKKFGKCISSTKPNFALFRPLQSCPCTCAPFPSRRAVQSVPSSTKCPCSPASSHGAAVLGCASRKCLSTLPTALGRCAPTVHVLPVSEKRQKIKANPKCRTSKGSRTMARYFLTGISQNSSTMKFSRFFSLSIRMPLSRSLIMFDVLLVV